MKVKRMFRKSLAIIVAIGIIIQLSSISFAVGGGESTEIIINCDVDCEKTQLIINAITGEASDYQTIIPSSILCLFGHNMAQGTAIEINHRFWLNPTRCRQTRYRVDYCTRSSCNHMILTQTTQSAIICCP